MNIEFSQEQKEAIAEKMELCASFLKTDIQPYLTSNDNLVVDMGEFIELCVTKNSMYVKQTRVLDLRFFEVPLNKVFYLEKNRKSVKKSKHYICFAAPALAVEFLQQWEKTKNFLQEKVDKKNEEVKKLDSFIDNFKI